MKRREKGCLVALLQQLLAIRLQGVQPHLAKTSLVRGEEKERAEAASGTTERREIPLPRTNRDNSSTIQQVQTNQTVRLFRGEIVLRGTEMTPTSRMLLSSHCETLEVLMEVEGAALDLAPGALVGAKITTYLVFFINCPPGHLRAHRPVLHQRIPPGANRYP